MLKYLAIATVASITTAVIVIKNADAITMYLYERMDYFQRKLDDYNPYQ